MKCKTLFGFTTEREVVSLDLKKYILFFILISQLACNKHAVNDDLKPTHEKKRLISSFYSSDQSGISSSVLTYDSLGHIISFTGTRGTIYNVYYVNGTIHYILSPVSWFNGAASRNSWIFVYDSDKKLKKVLVKGVDRGYGYEVVESLPFWGDENDGNASLADSLIYSSSGQLVQILMPEPATPYFRICQFIYDDLNSSVPSRINDGFDKNHDFIIDELDSQTTLTYTDTDQPASSQLWFFPFVHFYVPVTPSLPATYSRVFLPLLKKCIKHYAFGTSPGYYYTSKNFKYSYNRDSTIFDGVYDPDDITFDRFSYTFINQ